MSPLWMEEEDGTCSRPPFLPLPLSVLLPLPFICSSTQEPVGQPQSPHGHPSTEFTSRFISCSQRGAPGLGSDNTRSWELINTAGTGLSFHQCKHPKTLGCCSPALQLLNKMAPFSPAVHSLISHTSPCSLELQLTTDHSITAHPVLLSLLKQNFCACASYDKTSPVQLSFFLSWNLLSPFLSPFSFLLSWNFLESPFSFPFPFLEFPGISFLLPFPLFPFLSLPFPLDQSLIFLHFRLPFSGPNISPRALIYSFFPIFYQWDIYTYTKIQQTTRVYQGWHQQLLKSSHTAVKVRIFIFKCISVIVYVQIN